MYNECDSLTSKYKIVLDCLTCHWNQSIFALLVLSYLSIIFCPSISLFEYKSWISFKYKTQIRNASSQLSFFGLFFFFLSLSLSWIVIYFNFHVFLCLLAFSIVCSMSLNKAASKSLSLSLSLQKVLHQFECLHKTFWMETQNFFFFYWHFKFY